MIKLEEGESIEYVARRHWLLFLGEVAFLALLALAPLCLFLIPPSVISVLSEVFAPAEISLRLFFFLWSLWMLFLWMALTLFWTNYYLDVWILTNHRIVDVEQIGLFNRKVSSFRFDQIQDATVKVSGLLATLIDFGTVEIRTASNESFGFQGVARPNYLKNRILSEQHRVHTG
ncbi:MAG: hypothetical protein A2849_03120 [Candidatus Taylorbacteria bacterium RIFCSPHIGHO2_01_FULL_51_15]|uniref:YdbS-like PH domain-containing protein n=1 Tax=Candidatus Taylorbacteria bacterium RIFCSPHIGHO2_01_FULL_51_15 TaxID=1802304 RepID=A0A1G2M9S1_9BACT|nr:MAG: hypothetical protein A2849_03120 [Candidatus Taylorbacteria bacterium RIFCSPHIGHO2_01_FULL_51_15]